MLAYRPNLDHGCILFCLHGFKQACNNIVESCAISYTNSGSFWSSQRTQACNRQPVPSVEASLDPSEGLGSGQSNSLLFGLRLGNQTARVHIPDHPLASCMTLGMLPGLSVPVFPYLSNNAESCC